jgi:hypothetical protein
MAVYVPRSSVTISSISLAWLAAARAARALRRKTMEFPDTAAAVRLTERERRCCP